jgi:hypothetical protein
MVGSGFPHIQSVLTSVPLGSAGYESAVFVPQLTG